MRRLLIGVVLVLALLDGLIAQQPSATAQLNVIPVQGNVHMISGAGVNITVHVGKYGVLLVDTPRPADAPRVMDEIRKLSNLPLRWVINTSSSPEHVAGNAALVAPVQRTRRWGRALRIRRPGSSVRGGARERAQSAVESAPG